MTEYEIYDHNHEIELIEYNMQVLYADSQLHPDEPKHFVLFFIYLDSVRTLYYSEPLKRFELGFPIPSDWFVYQFIHEKFHVFKIAEVQKVTFKYVLSWVKSNIEYHQIPEKINPRIHNGIFMDSIFNSLNLARGVASQTTSEEYLGQIIANILRIHKERLGPKLRAYADEHGIDL